MVATLAPSMWLKLRMRAPSATRAPGPKTTKGSMVVPAPTSVSQAKWTVSGADMVTPAARKCSRWACWNRASAWASSDWALTPMTESSAAKTARVGAPRLRASSTTSVR
ncbi:hypothetical protein D3C85_1129980 [compost metagenome]